MSVEARRLAACLLPLGASLALACAGRTGLDARATSDASVELPSAWNCHAPGKTCTPLCGQRAGVGSGASNGPFTVRGHVLDGSGAPVIGARLELSGDASAVRYTDFTGGFTFHLDGGDFRLNATAFCPLSPAGLEIHGLTGDATYTLTAAPTGTSCVTCPLRGRASPGFIRTLKREGVALADVDALVLAWGAEAVTADLEKGREQPLGSGGWLCDLAVAELPAIELQIPVHRHGAPDEQGRTDWDLLSLGTNIAVGDTLVSFQAVVDPATPQETIDLFFATARNFTPEELPELFSP